MVSTAFPPPPPADDLDARAAWINMLFANPNTMDALLDYDEIKRRVTGHTHLPT